MQFTVDFLSLHPSPKTKQLFSKKMKKDKPKKKNLIKILIKKYFNKEKFVFFCMKRESNFLM